MSLLPIVFKKDFEFIYALSFYVKKLQNFSIKQTCQSVLNIYVAYMYCTTFHRYPIFSTRYSVMCKVYTGYCGTSEIEHGLCACTVDNPLAKARGLSLRTGAQTMFYLSHRAGTNLSRDSPCYGDMYILKSNNTRKR